MKFSRPRVWNDIPKKVLTKIIGYLDPESKRNLSLCSKKHWNIISGKIDFVDKLFFSGGFFGTYEINLAYENEEDGENTIEFEKGPNYPDFDDDDDYDYDFEDEEMEEEGGGNGDGQEMNQKSTIVKFKGSAFGEEDETEITEIGSTHSVAVKYFKKYLVKYHKQIGLIYMTEFKDKLSDLEEIENFPRLHELNVCIKVFEYFAEIIKHPLKTLKVTGFIPFLALAFGTRSPVSFPLMYHVTEELEIPEQLIPYELFLRLKAKKIHVAIYLFEEDHFIEIIKSWLDGTMRQDIEFCYFQKDNEKGEKDIDSIMEKFDCLEIGSDNYGMGFMVSCNENRRVFRIMNESNPESFMDIIYGDEGLILTFNNKKAYDYDRPADNSNHICDLNFCCVKNIKDLPSRY